MEGLTFKEKIILEKTNKFLKKHKPSFVLTAIVILSVLIGNAIYFSIWPSDDKTLLSSLTDIENDNCSVVGINLHGTLLTYIAPHSESDPLFNYDSVASEDIYFKIKQANEDESIKAIILEVDSGGGSGIAGEEVSNIIKNSAKPVVGWIRSVSASASYFAVSSADRIFASKFSDVGGIGVTASYLSNVKKNQKDGLNYEQLIAGKYKDSGRPDKPLTEEEKKLFLRDINIGYENFMKAVSANRNIPIEKVREIADGSTVMGEQAKELGLIDEIGGINEVEKYLEETIGEKPEICWK